MNTEVHIERLILDGLPMARYERPLLQAAVEEELTHLLTDDGLTPATLVAGPVPYLRAADLNLPAQFSPSDLGRRIARALYGGLKR